MANSKESGPQYPSIKFSDIKKIERLGSGSFGVVHKARWKNKIVAIKEFESNLGKKELEKEVKPLHQIKSHPNIIGFYGAAVEGYQGCIVMEFAAGGSLDKFIHFHPRRNYSTGDAISFALQCAQGVKYLHEKNLLHRDLKPANLLLVNDFQVLKICDFGTVAVLKSTMSNNRGTPRWMAPEVYKGKKYTEKCDVYSWSIILWELFSRALPFQDKEPCTIQFQVLDGTRPEPITHCSKEIQKIMETCWDNDPDKRYSMEEVIQKMTSISESCIDRDDLVTGILEGSQDSSDNATDTNLESSTIPDNTKIPVTPQPNSTGHSASCKINIDGPELSSKSSAVDTLLPTKIMMNGSEVQRIERLTCVCSKSMEDYNSGNFGVYFKAKWQNESVIVKVYANSIYTNSIYDIDKRVKKKIKRLATVRMHPNFIQLLDSSFRESGTYLIMEYADGGSLFDFLHEEPRLFYSARQATQWLLKLADAFCFLNDKNLKHRNLISRNIFLTYNYQIVKVGDFLNKPEAQYLSDLEKSVYCLPDELQCDNKFTKATVSFCWGILAWEIIFREKPHAELFDKSYQTSLFLRCPRPLVDIMINCWESHVYDRPNIELILKFTQSLSEYFPIEEAGPEDEENRNHKSVLQTIQDSSISGIYISW